MNALDVIAGREPWAVEQGDALTLLRTLSDGCVHMVCTSPPYFGLRSYLPAGHPDKPREMGCEQLHDCLGWATGNRCGVCFVDRMTEVFREVRRVLHPSGTLWCNIAGSYAAGGHGGHAKGANFHGHQFREGDRVPKKAPAGWKAKDYLNVPALLSESLRADGWYLRSEITLAKLAPMPESCRDRPTRACEKLYLLAKSARCFYDQEAERVTMSDNPVTAARRLRADNGAVGTSDIWGDGYGQSGKGDNETVRQATGRNLWDWWSGEGLEEEAGDLPEPFWAWRPEPSRHKHYAAFPSWLPRRCIRLGSSPRGVCPSCRAPWVRVVERTQRKRHRPNDHVKRTGEDGTGNVCANTVAGTSTTTTGWAPSCRCPAHSPIPALVLDPFAGSGVTGMVAREQGRSFVGFDLSPDYVALARKRIGQQNPLLDHCDRVPHKPVAAETPSLFA